jgi:hypothetical protein
MNYISRCFDDMNDALLNGAQQANGVSVPPANSSIFQKLHLSFAQTVSWEEAYAGMRRWAANTSSSFFMKMNSTGVRAWHITLNEDAIYGGGTSAFTMRACHVYLRAMFDHTVHSDSISLLLLLPSFCRLPNPFPLPKL